MGSGSSRYAAGMDLGSTTIKVVIYDGSRYIARMTFASWNRRGPRRA